MKILLTTFFTVMIHGQEADGTHNYYLYNGFHKIHASINSAESLNVPVGFQARFKLDLECLPTPTIKDTEYFCNAIDWELK